MGSLAVELTGRAHIVNAFRRGSSEAGYVEGQNVAVEYYSAENQPDRLRTLVAESDSRASGRDRRKYHWMIAAKAATSTVPIVFAGGTDPIELGLVGSLDRPGGNVTGAPFLRGVGGKTT